MLAMWPQFRCLPAGRILGHSTDHLQGHRREEILQPGRQALRILRSLAGVPWGQQESPRGAGKNRVMVLLIEPKHIRFGSFFWLTFGYVVSAAANAFLRIARRSSTNVRHRCSAPLCPPSSVTIRRCSIPGYLQFETHIKVLAA